MSRAIIEKEITQGVVPIGIPKAYQYDQALVESAKAEVQQGIESIETKTEQEKSAIASFSNSQMAGYATSASNSASTAESVATALTDIYNEAISEGTVIAPAVDTTLSVSGAAADAKVVGDRFTFDKRFIGLDGVIDFGGYKQTDGLYIAVSERKFLTSATISLITIPIKSNTIYKVEKATSTIMRVATGTLTTPVANESVTKVVAHASASSLPLYIRSGATDIYMYIQLYANGDDSSLMSVEANTASLVITENTDAVIKTILDGYTEQAYGNIFNLEDYLNGQYYIADGTYINTTGAVGSAGSTNILVIPAKPNTNYIVYKPTKTTMRVAIGFEAEPSAGDSLAVVVEHDSSSDEPLYVTTGANDEQYVYIQLYTSGDVESYRRNDAHVANLVVMEDALHIAKNNSVRISSLAGDAVLNQFTYLVRLYIGTNGKIFYDDGDKPVKTISVPIVGGKRYTVRKSTETIMRVGSGVSEVPTVGTQLKSYVYHSTASSAPLEIQTLPNDNYLYIQLFATSDDSDLQSIAAHLDSLFVYATNNAEEGSALKDLNTIQEINHRGYENLAPENTLPAFRMSKQNDYEWVEMDLKKTSDGVIVLLHDTTINRTARNADGSPIDGTVYINQITYEQALTYDFGIWKNASYAGTKIPTLEQALNLCRCIGLKMTFDQMSNVIPSDVITLVQQYGMEDRVEYMAGDKVTVTNIANLVHNGHIGYNGTIDNTIPDFVESLMINGNTIYVHSDVYAEGTTERGILDEIASMGVKIVSRAYSQDAVTNAPTYCNIFITNTLHPKQILYDIAMS